MLAGIIYFCNMVGLDIVAFIRAFNLTVSQSAFAREANRLYSVKCMEQLIISLTHQHSIGEIVLALTARNKPSHHDLHCYFCF